MNRICCHILPVIFLFSEPVRESKCGLWFVTQIESKRKNSESQTDYTLTELDRIQSSRNGLTILLSFQPNRVESSSRPYETCWQANRIDSRWIASIVIPQGLRHIHRIDCIQIESGFIHCDFKTVTDSNPVN